MRMASLPLPEAADPRENEDMKANNLLRRVVSTIREMNDAVKLSTEFRLSRGLGFADEPPATYGEFLLRTSATSAHEPSAARRQATGRDGGSEDRSCRC
jgi:hypothetical protein